MKTKFFTIVLLIASIAAYAQPSRRGEQEQDNNNRGQSERKRGPEVSSRDKGQQQYRKSEPDRKNNHDNSSYNRGRGDNDGDRNRYSNNGRRDDHKGNRGGNYYSGHNHSYSGSYHHGRVVEFRRPGSRVEVVRYRPNYRPVSVQYRRVHYPYRVPVRREFIWSVNLSNTFSVYYPEIRIWNYPVGYRIPSIPAYDADEYVGEVAVVYGRVIDAYYAYENDEFYLYFGDYHPYQDFSVVIPGHEARRLSSRPDRYFLNEYVSVSGYITRYDGKPEIIVRHANQVSVY